MQQPDQGHEAGVADFPVIEDSNPGAEVLDDSGRLACRASVQVQGGIGHSKHLLAASTVQGNELRHGGIIHRIGWESKEVPKVTKVIKVTEGKQGDHDYYFGYGE